MSNLDGQLVNFANASIKKDSAPKAVEMQIAHTHSNSVPVSPPDTASVLDVPGPRLNAQGLQNLFFHSQ